MIHPDPFYDSGFNGKTILIDVVRASYIPEFSMLMDRESYTLFELLRVALQEGRIAAP